MTKELHVIRRVTTRAKSSYEQKYLSRIPLALTGFAAEADSQQAMHWYRCHTHTHSSAFEGSDSNGSPD